MPTNRVGAENLSSRLERARECITRPAMSTYTESGKEVKPTSERSERRFSLGPPPPTYRVVHSNKPTENAKLKYRDNNVSTTKYKMHTFVVVNLMEQFSRMANVYFLIISILTSLPISPKDYVSLVGTFVAVLLVSAIKEAYEDIQRNNSDNETNTQMVR